MKKLLIIIILFCGLVTFSQPQFSANAVNAPAGGTGEIEVQILNPDAGMFPVKITVTPDGGQAVIVKDSINTALIEIYNVPVGLFHMQIKDKKNRLLFGDQTIYAVMPSGKKVINATIIKYP